MAEGRFKAFRVHGFAFTASGSALCLLLEASGLGLALGDITSWGRCQLESTSSHTGLSRAEVM